MPTNQEAELQYFKETLESFAGYDAYHVRPSIPTHSTPPLPTPHYNHNHPFERLRDCSGRIDGLSPRPAPPKSIPSVNQISTQHHTNIFYTRYVRYYPLSLARTFIHQLSANHSRRMNFLTLPKAQRDLLVSIGYKEKLERVDEGIRRCVSLASSLSLSLVSFGFSLPCVRGMGE